MKQRILAILLSLTMMFTLVPTAWVLSEEEKRTPAPMETSENGEGTEGSGSVAPEMSGNCGATEADHVTWELTDADGDGSYNLTISGEGAMADYTANINNGSATQPWRTSVTGVEISNITKVVVSEGVTSIGDFAFNGLTAVSEYVIGANVSAINQWALDTSAAKVFNLNGNTNFQTDVDGVLFSEDGKTLIAYPGGSAVRDEYTVPSTVTTISDGAFVGCPMPDGKVSVEAEFVKTAATSFADVPANAYFADAVKWAVDKGITNGLSDTMFGPYESCTRAQIVTFLWRAAGSPEPKTASSFTDVPVSAYYAKAVAWAVENGITNGMTETTFAPNATCTRGQSVTFLHRALKGTASGSANFTDVKSDAFYADAINWAVANNVTNGTSNTTFSPNADCTRAEIVTFLYRAYQGK